MIDMSSCFCSSRVFIMCLTHNSLTLVSALVPCSTSVFKSTLQPVNLTLHFTFSENCLNLKSGYLHKMAIKSLLQSCLCLFSTCECSPGIHPQVYMWMCMGLYLKMTESEEYSEPVPMSVEYCTFLWCGPLTGCCMVKDQW